MKKSVVIVLAVVAVLLFTIFGVIGWANGVYNTAVVNQETVDKSWANVQSAYQRRADLVPQLVATVKKAAENEGSILKEVTQARAGITNAKTPEDLELMGRKINTAINLAYEAYPEIRSTQNFATLQQQLEGTENRIKVERDAYNDAVSKYNIHVRGIFRKFALNILGDADEFPRKEGFKTTTPGAENAPDVSKEFDK